ncbi:protoporphyrinogen oxidase [Corynebacterium aquilae]|uniref:Coproporphyrinogen III oxidase n=1 Tax=Corynebacterium aquilae DSM 44791 TaxID=1431546 RepID=A0A1L7CDM8_9CORY|nr:protoporphyrinogen oxidase [Corynebacterium aquilae]APT83951.1 protoporphyrinogen oxidase [Corynebacterium aquilae DSM 44791]
MKIAIIGAGLAGLVAAYELRDDADVTVFEASDRIGGKLFTVPFSCGPVDMGAEAFLNYRADAREFFDELGLERVYPSTAKPAVYVDGALHPMPMADTLMGIPATSAPVAHLVSPETARAIDEETSGPGISWEEGQDVSLGQLVADTFGRDLVTHLIDALLGGVYSCTADDLGLRATVPALAGALDAQAAAGGPVYLSTAVQAVLSSRPPRNEDTPVFGTFPGGYAELYDTLAERSGAEIYIDAFITGITRTPQGTYTLKGGEGEYDRVLIATPAPTAALLIGGVNPKAAAELKDIKLASSAVVGLRFADASALIDNSGVLVATDAEGVTAKAFTISSNKWPHLAQRGGALIRASFGRFGDDAITRADEDELVDLALDDVHTVIGFDGRAAEPTDIFVQRWYGGLPRYDEQHLARVARISAALEDTPTITATGAWAHGVGVPDVIASARAAAKTLI